MNSVQQPQVPPQSAQAGGPAIVELGLHDDLASLRYRLDHVDARRVALSLPWDLDFLSRELDYDLLRREAQRRGLEFAVVSPDPQRRQLATGCGFPAFQTEERAMSADRWNGRSRERVEPPPEHWWEEEIELKRERRAAGPAWWRRIWQGARYAIFLIAVVAVAAGAYVLGPSADITLVPVTETVTVHVPVSVDPAVESITYLENSPGGILPSRRVGLEVEGRAAVGTTGMTEVASGRAVGEVLLTSRLSQDYVVPSGTIVRTSSTSYPIRFRTTADVVVPADGQATAPIEALDDRTGNVGAYQINRVEGVAGSAVRVINPSATTGAEGKEVPVVLQEDYDRVREQLTQDLLDKAYGELHQLLEEDEFLPYPSLRVEAVPKKVYSHFVGEEAEQVTLNMRLLVSGQAVSADQARSVARQALVERVPDGHELIEAQFQVGDLVEEEEGPGWFTFYVTGQGWAAAVIDEGAVMAEARGMRIPEARAHLEESFPLAQPPEIVSQPKWPEWLAFLDRVPIIPLRLEVHVRPEASGMEVGSSESAG